MTDAQGQPVTAAHLFVLRSPWRRAQQIVAARFSAREIVVSEMCADTLGHFETYAPAGLNLRLRVEAPGFAMLERRLPTGTESLQICLSTGVTVQICVRDADDHPAEGVRIRLYRAQTPEGTVFNRVAVTDNHGRASIEGLPRGASGWYEAVHPVRGCFRVGTFDLAEDTLHVIEVRQQVGLGLHGCVLDGATGAPIPGARVSLGCSLQCERHTDAAGRFLFPGPVAWSRAEVRVWAQGYAPVALQPKTKMCVRLSRATRVYGRVLDERGLPLASARVSAVAKGEWLAASAVETDAGGRYCLTHVPAGRPILLVVDADGFAAHQQEATAPLANSPWDCPLEHRLTVGQRVRGVVAAPADARVRGAKVELRRRDGLTWSRAPIPGHYPYSGRSFRRVSDRRGRFEFSHVPPGTYTLCVRCGGRLIYDDEVIIQAGQDAMLTLAAYPGK